MKKIIRILAVIAIVTQSALTNSLNQTAVRSPTENATSTTLPPNHKNNSQLIDRDHFKGSASVQAAEKRLFPVGSPELITNYVSPFDVSSFGKQLLPLLNVNIKEKVKSFARDFNEGADYIEDAIRDGWRESPLNPNNFKSILDGPSLLKHLPIPSPNLLNGLRRPVYLPPPSKAQFKPKEKAPKAIESYTVDNMMQDYGIDGYKHFEQSILRELERQEERKVEATIHTLFEQGERVQIIQGKPYDFKSGWQPVAAPTKSYEDDTNEVHSQIVSPLHTSFLGSEPLSSSSPDGFHDFDHLNDNPIHSTYSVYSAPSYEEEGESKVEPVTARVKLIRRVTPAPRKTTSVHFSSTTGEKSRYRKRQNNNVKTMGMENIVVTDSGARGSHDAPTVVNKKKRAPSRLHVQSLTTAKPRVHVKLTRVHVTEAPKVELSTENSVKVSLTHSSEAPWRLRPTFGATKTTRPPTTTTTTKVPAPRNVVARETSKFVDKTKVSGFRGSVKFGQSTTKAPI